MNMSLVPPSPVERVVASAPRGPTPLRAPAAALLPSAPTPAPGARPSAPFNLLASPAFGASTACLLLLLAFCSATAAQSLTVDRFVLSTGGGTTTNTQFNLTGTLAQPDATPALTSSRYTVEGGFWSTAIAVQTPGAPLLTITRLGSTAVLSWELGYPGFIVEVSDSLFGGWQPLGITPTPSGIVNTVTVGLTPTPTMRFYRLRWLSNIIPVQFPGSPQLSVTRVGDTEVLSWDIGYPGHVVEVSDNLFVWQPLGLTPTAAGNTYAVSVPLAATMKFYRLRKP